MTDQPSDGGLKGTLRPPSLEPPPARSASGAQGPATPGSPPGGGPPPGGVEQQGQAPEPSRHRWLVPVAVVLLLLVGTVSFVVARTLTGGNGDTAVELVAADETGSYPFTPSVASVSLDEVTPALERASELEEEVTPQREEPTRTSTNDDLVVTRTAVDSAIVYASRAEGVCETDLLAETLEADDEVRTAWATLMGVEEDKVRATVDALTPLVLARDTAVTNSRYADGEASRFQAILQAGTPVLVDAAGTPRVKCSCGNPLAPPRQQAGATITGTRWKKFSPTAVVEIDTQEDSVPALRTVDLDTRELTTVRLGGAVTLSGYLLDDARGVYVIGEDGTRTQVVNHPVAVVYDDGAGGLLFQNVRSQAGSWVGAPYDTVKERPADADEAAIWHLPAGATDPVRLLASDDPGARWYALQAAGLLDGRPAAVYSEVTRDPALGEEMELMGSMTLRYLDDGEEHPFIEPVSLYEGAFGPVTMAGSRMAVNTSYDLPAYDLYDAGGRPLPGGCAYPDDGETECEEPSVLRSNDQYVALHIEAAGSFFFNVQLIDANSGARLSEVVGTEAVDDESAFENPPSELDAVGDRAVLSWPTWRSQADTPALPTLLLDIASETGTLLDFTGRTRILRAPLVRPRPSEGTESPTSTSTTTATTAPERTTEPSTSSVQACLTDAEATDLLRRTGRPESYRAMTVEMIRCVDGWADGTLVQETDGMGLVLFRSVGGGWEFVYGAGSVMTYCEAARDAGAPSDIWADLGC